MSYVKYDKLDDVLADTICRSLDLLSVTLPATWTDKAIRYATAINANRLEHCFLSMVDKSHMGYSQGHTDFLTTVADLADAIVDATTPLTIEQTRYVMYIATYVMMRWVEIQSGDMIDFPIFGSHYPGWKSVATLFSRIANGLRSVVRDQSFTILDPPPLVGHSTSPPFDIFKIFVSRVLCRTLKLWYRRVPVADSRTNPMGNPIPSQPRGDGVIRFDFAKLSRRNINDRVDDFIVTEVMKEIAIEHPDLVKRCGFCIGVYVALVFDVPAFRGGPYGMFSQAERCAYILAHTIYRGTASVISMRRLWQTIPAPNC